MQTQDEECLMVKNALDAIDAARRTIEKAKIVGEMFSKLLECQYVFNNMRFTLTTAKKIEEMCTHDKKEQIWPYVLYSGRQLARKLMTHSLPGSEIHELCKRLHKSICRISVGSATKAQVSWGNGKTVEKTMIFTENDFVRDERGIAFYIYRKSEESMRFLRTPDKLVIYLYEDVAIEE